MERPHSDGANLLEQPHQRGVTSWTMIFPATRSRISGAPRARQAGAKRRSHTSTARHLLGDNTPPSLMIIDQSWHEGRRKEEMHVLPTGDGPTSASTLLEPICDLVRRIRGDRR
jgi:hypothetical protein